MPKIQTTRIYREIDNAIKNGYKVVSAQGSSRSSKTYNIVIWLIIYAATHKIVLTIVRSTLPSIRGSVLRDFEEVLQKLGLFDERKRNKTELTYYLPNGSLIEFISTDSEQKLRGRKRDVLFVNEANEIKYIEWQQLIWRTRRFAIVDYNPSFSDGHWLCQLNADPSTYQFISTYKDNPFLEQTIIDEIEKLQWQNKTLWQVFGLGQMAVVEGLVFENFEQVDSFPETAKHQAIGLDFGFTHDPTAAVRCGLIGDNLYLDELFYRPGMLSTHIIEELKRLNLQMEIIADSADQRLIQEISNAGLLIYPVMKPAGSILAGIDKMKTYKLHVTKRSLNLIKELRNYTWAKDKDDHYVNVPIDAFNHLLDASRYYCYGKLLGNIMQTVTISADDIPY